MGLWRQLRFLLFEELLWCATFLLPKDATDTWLWLSAYPKDDKVNEKPDS